MQALFKYDLDVTRRPNCVIPAPVRLLDVQCQEGRLVFWAIVQLDAGEQRLDLRILPTGERGDITESLAGYRHWQTVQVGAFVWHIFIAAKQHQAWIQR